MALYLIATPTAILNEDDLAGDVSIARSSQYNSSERPTVILSFLCFNVGGFFDLDDGLVATI